MILLSSFRRVVSGLLVSYSWIVFDGGQITFFVWIFPTVLRLCFRGWMTGRSTGVYLVMGVIDTVEAQGVVALVASGGDV